MLVALVFLTVLPASVPPLACGLVVAVAAAIAAGAAVSTRS
jgi:hypothetical protein